MKRLNLLLAALALLPTLASAELVGVNEAAYVPQHPEQRLANLAMRGRGWKNGSLGLTAGAGDFYELGTYSLKWTGAIDVSLSGGKGNVELLSEQPGQRVYRVTGHGKAGLILRHSGPAPETVSLICGSVETDGPFTAAFIKDMARFDLWRPMDLTRTNGSTQVEWLDRPTLRGPPGEWFAKGWPWELIIDASNRAGLDPWICVPHAASDDYVQQLGKLFVELLDPGRTVYLEYSNECWNTGPAFDQSRWIVGNLSGGRFADRHVAYGRRAAQVCQVFANTLDRSRFRFVLAGQSGGLRVLEEALEGCGDTRPNMLSVAAYFNPGKEGLFTDYKANGPRADAAFDLMRQSISETRSVWWTSHAELAERLGLPLIAYEGGSHTAASGGTERQDAAYVEWLKQLDRNPRMVDIYRLLRETWPGDGLLYFQRLAGPTKFGSWGHQWFAGDVANAKNLAVNEHLAEREEPKPTDDWLPGETVLD